MIEAMRLLFQLPHLYLRLALAVIKGIVKSFIHCLTQILILSE